MTEKTTRQRRIIHGLDLSGWDAIAGALDVSVATVKRWTARDSDPLPAKRFMGKVRASSEAVREWAQRNTMAA